MTGHRKWYDVRRSRRSPTTNTPAVATVRKEYIQDATVAELRELIALVDVLDAHAIPASLEDYANGQFGAAPDTAGYSSCAAFFIDYMRAYVERYQEP
jgi:hypothetical protein